MNRPEDDQMEEIANASAEESNVHIIPSSNKKVKKIPRYPQNHLARGPGRSDGYLAKNLAVLQNNIT